jgi:hypothetical protein
MARLTEFHCQHVLILAYRCSEENNGEEFYSGFEEF